MEQCRENQNIEPGASPWRLSMHNSPLYELLTEANTTPHRTSPEPHRPALDASLPHSPRQVIPTRRARNRWWHRIGISGLLVLSIGTFFIVASCAILIYLWRGADATRNRDEPVFWRTIVVRGWATRVVTICSAIIRTLIGLQVGLMTAATASIMLETSGTPLIDAPVLSIQRALKGSPLNILPAVLRGNTAGDISRWFKVLIPAIALLITFVSTFMSTILLSDFTSNQIAAPSTTDAVTVTSASRVYPRNGASYWKSRPASQWRFAESKENKTSRTKGDTGDTYRAYLPFSNAESRTSLEYYSGPTIVTNLRTFCVAPEILNATLEWDRNTTEVFVTLEEDPHSFDHLGGSMIAGENSTVKAMIVNQWNSSSSQSGWPLSLYHDDQFALDGGPVDPLIVVDPAYNRVILFNSSIKVNSTWSYQTNWSEPVQSMLDDLRDLSWKKEGLWTTFSNPNGTRLLSATSCLFNIIAPPVYNVTMSGRGVQSEPNPDINLLATKKDTEDIRHQFGIGIDRMDFDSRGILDLEIHDRLTEIEPGNPGINVLLYGALRDRATGGEGWWAFDDDLQTLSANNRWSAHISHITTLQGIIQETGDPAIAVQAFVTRLYQMSYYDWLTQFNVKYSVTMVHAIDMLIPTRWIGLLIVLCLVGLHFALCLITLFLFLTCTKTTELGNAWQAIAQIVSPQTRDVLDLADEMSDKEIKEILKVTGRDQGLYTVSRCAKYDRLQIQLRQSKGEVRKA